MTALLQQRDTGSLCYHSFRFLFLQTLLPWMQPRTALTFRVLLLSLYGAEGGKRFSSPQSHCYYDEILALLLVPFHQPSGNHQNNATNSMHSISVGIKVILIEAQNP